MIFAVRKQSTTANTDRTIKETPIVGIITNLLRFIFSISPGFLICHENVVH